MGIKVALVQMDIAWEGKPANFAKARGMIAEAKKRGADIAVLPELFATGVLMGSAGGFAEAEKGETVSFLKRLAREEKMNIIGAFLEKGKHKPHNSAVAVDKRGKLLAKYRKIHPFSFSGEHKFYEGGNKVCVFNLAGVRCGLEICYDVRFPELTRKMALAGAQIIFVPANFGAARIEHWDALLRARAIENQLFIVGVNRVGRAPDSDYNGHSAVYDPWGKRLSGISEREQVILAELELEEVRKVRARITCFKDRKPEAY